MNATTTYAPPASRNAPCPCGSGRRWKECHGRVATPSSGGAPDADAVARMHAALAAQRAGRLAEAIAIYGDVVAGHPAIFDAWHMRGVAHFQLLEFDAAERDIRRALEIEPGLDAARRNLDLVIEGRRALADVEALCRAVLPRYGALVVAPAVPPLDGVAAGDRVYVIDAGAPAPIVESLVRDAAGRGAGVVTMTVDRGRTIRGDDALALASADGGDVIVCAGCSRPLGDWTLDSHARATTLVVDGADLPSVIDRLREASGQGRRRVRLAALARAAVETDPLPCYRGRLP